MAKREGEKGRMKGIENQNQPPTGDRMLVQFPGFSIQLFSSNIPHLPSSFFPFPAPVNLQGNIFNPFGQLRLLLF
jgi:hypothetical protein